MAKKFKELFNKMSPDRQARINAKVKNTLKEMSLAEIRELHQVTQENIATILQVKQSSVSKLEQRSNVTVERLRDYAQALGGELEVRIIIDEQSYPVKLTHYHNSTTEETIMTP